MNYIIFVQIKKARKTLQNKEIFYLILFSKWQTREAPFKVEDENFMAVCFNGNTDKLNGIIECDKVFGI